MSRKSIKRSSTLLVPMAVTAVGCGIDELAKEFDDATVSWALLRFQSGTGTFARTKIVSITNVGEDTPAVRRGRLISRCKEATAIFGETHAAVEVHRGKECTVDWLCGVLNPMFTADNMGEFTMENLKEEYEKANAEAIKARAERKAGVKPEAPAAEPEPTAAPEPVAAEAQPKKEKVVIPVREALGEVSKPMGHFNWLLLDARRLDVHGMGHGGLEEMKESLDPSLILFGLVRFTFVRDGSPPIVKFLFLHWIGEGVSAVKRAQLNAKLDAAVEEIRKFASVTFRRTAYDKDTLDLEGLIDELKKVTYGSEDLGISPAWYLSSLDAEIKEIEKALKAEESKPAEEEKAGEADAAGSGEDSKEEKVDLPDMDTAVQGVRQLNGEFNWVLLGCCDLR